MTVRRYRVVRYALSAVDVLRVFYFGFLCGAAPMLLLWWLFS